MAGFQNPIKLGRPRKELSFTANVDELGRIDQQIGSQERIVKNSVGELFKRTFRKQMADFRVRPEFPTSDTLKNQLEGLKLIADEPLSFFFADDWPIISDRYTMETTTTFTLSTSPYTRLGMAYKAAGGGDADIISFTPTGGGVFLDYDATGGQVSTDLFSAYAADTRIVTISPAQSVGTVVYANWFYKGALVNMRPFRPQNRGGNVSAGKALWTVSLRLEGV